MTNGDSFFLALITSLISFTLGFFSAYLRDWLKQRKENKKIQKAFLRLFEGFSFIENPKKAQLLVIINTLNLDRKILSNKLEMLVGIHYSPEKKTIHKKTDGGFNEYKYKDESKAKIPYEKEIIRKFSLNTRSSQDYYIMNYKIDSITLQFEDENWLVIIGFFPFIIWDKNREKENEFNYREFKKSNKEVLIDFLKTLEYKYKQAKIISKSKLLVDDKLITKIKNFKDKNTKSK